MIARHQLTATFDQLLLPAQFRDYAPNGLQVEGKPAVSHLVSGVTASRALIEAAIGAGADALLVHHGLFWRGQDACITGWMRQRLALLLSHDINLYAYHLPLDAHPELGNNAQLGLHLGFKPEGRFGEQGLGWIGSLSSDVDSAETLANYVGQQLGRPVILVDGLDRPPRRVAWCTGGAQSYFESAIAAGADVFVTGEISEPQAHYARECGVAYIACGHHASERYGAPALGAAAAATLGLRHTFLDVDNPA